jgi:hypothetical protein
MQLADNDSLVRETDQILGASQRAKTLVKSLLAFSSNQKIDMKPIDLNSIISGGRRLLLQLVSERTGVRMNCCNVPLTIMGDRSPGVFSRNE